MASIEEPAPIGQILAHVRVKGERRANGDVQSSSVPGCGSGAPGGAQW